MMDFDLERLLPLSKDPDLLDHLKSYMSYYRSILDLGETAKATLVNCETSFFQPGYNPEIDAIQRQMTETKMYFQLLTQHMSQLIAPHRKTSRDMGIDK